VVLRVLSVSCIWPQSGGLHGGLHGRPVEQQSALLFCAFGIFCTFYTSNFTIHPCHSLPHAAHCRGAPQQLDVVKQVLKSLLDRLAPDDSGGWPVQHAASAAACHIVSASSNLVPGCILPFLRRDSWHTEGTVLGSLQLAKGRVGVSVCRKDSHEQHLRWRHAAVCQLKRHPNSIARSFCSGAALCSSSP
jgi:hypothetical protein